MPAGAFRALAAAVFACAFCLPAPGLFAQVEPGLSESESLLTDTGMSAAEAIAAAERQIILGEDTVPAVVNPVSVWSILRVLLTLALVAAAIYGIIFLMKRGMRVNVSKDPFLKILASTQLGVNRSAYVISVGTQAWLVGAAENGVNLIAEIGDKEILDAMLLQESVKTSENAPGRFLDFKALMGKLGMNVGSGAPGPDNIRRRSERLKGL